MQAMWKRSLAMLLALVMVLGNVPVSAFAMEEEVVEENAEEVIEEAEVYEEEVYEEEVYEEIVEEVVEEEVIEEVEEEVVSFGTSSEVASTQLTNETPIANGANNNTEGRSIGEEELTSVLTTGGEIALNQNIELTKSITIPAGVTVTLDLNGFTISQTKEQTSGYEMIVNDGNLTIQDTVGNGKISYTDSGNGGEYNSDTIINRGTLTLKSGRVENLSSETVAFNGYPYAIDTSIWGSASEVNTIIDGGEVYCQSYSAMRLRGDSTTEAVNITVNGGEITGTIEVQNAAGCAAEGKLTINDGELSNSGTANVLFIFGNNVCTALDVEIKGGSFAGNVTVKDSISSDFDQKFITGGTFSSDVGKFCVEGYACTENEDDTWSVAPAETQNFVAEVNGTKCETLEEAIAVGGEVKVLKDIVLEAPITIAAGETVTLDLNGKTVAYNSTTQDEAMITNKGNLTINDSSDSDAGVINYNYTGAADSSYGKGNYTISNEGNLTVNGGKITIANLSGHAKYPIDNNSTTGNAVLVINGGHLYNYNTSAIRQFCNSTTYENSVTINGGLIEGYCAIWVQNPGKNTVHGALSITGGEIKSTAKAYVSGTSELKDVSSKIYCTIDGEGGAWSNDSAVSLIGGTFNENVYLAEGAPAAINVEGNATFNGKLELPKVYVAEINGEGYETLKDAMDAAQDGQTVKLLANVQLDKVLQTPRYKTITLDLNGMTITAGDSLSCIGIAPGSCTLTDTSAEQNGVIKGTHGASISLGGTLIVTAGNIEAEYGGFMGYGTAIMNGGKLTCRYIESFSGDNAKFTTTGGTFDKDPSEYLAYGYECKESNGTWTVTKKAVIVPPTVDDSDNSDVVVDEENKTESGVHIPGATGGTTGGDSGTPGTPTLDTAYVEGLVKDEDETVPETQKVTRDEKTAIVTDIATNTAGAAEKNEAAIQNVTAAGNSSKPVITLEVALKQVTAKKDNEDSSTAPVTTKVTYTVAPKDSDDNKVSTLSKEITFRLPLPASFMASMAKIYHNGNLTDIVQVQGENNGKFVEVTSRTFSEYAVEAASDVEPKNYVAMVGTQSYETLAAALEAAQAGETVTLLKDVTMSSILTIDKAITLDGNGKTLTSNVNAASAGNHRAINVTGADGVTIQNLTIETNGERAINIIKNSTNVTIDNVTATASNYAVNVGSAPDAVITIKDSNLTGGNTVNISDAADNVQMTITDTTITCIDNSDAEGYGAIAVSGENVVVVVNNGEIVITGSKTNGSNASTVNGNGSQVNFNGTVGATPNANHVAAIRYSNGQFYSFPDLASAIKFAQAGETVELLTDVTIDQPITLTKNITIDGNFKTLTYTGTDRAITAESGSGAKDVTIKDLVVAFTKTAQRGINYNEAGGKLTLSNVTVDSNEGKLATYALNLPGSADKATVTIENSTLEGNIALNIWCSDATITCTDSHFTSFDFSAAEDYNAVVLNNDIATVAEGTKVIFNGGSIAAKNEKNEASAVAVNNTNTGSFEISEGTQLYGNYPVYREAIVTFKNTTAFYYANTLEEAIACAKEDPNVKTIYLLRDAELEEGFHVAPADVTIDLNGKTLIGDVAGTLKMSKGTFKTTDYTMVAPENAIYISEDGVFTIAANATMDTTLVSGTYSLGLDTWYTLEGQTLTIKKDVSFTIAAGKSMQHNGKLIKIEEGADLKLYGDVKLINPEAKIEGPEGLNITTTVANSTVVYENGVYSVKPAVVEKKIIDEGRSLSLEGVIYINQYVTVEGFEGVDVEKNGGLLIWTDNVETNNAVLGSQDIHKPGMVKYAETENGWEYRMQSQGIPAAHYADTIWLRAYIQDDEGIITYGPLKEYSVREYCENRLEKSDSQYMKNVCAAMLNYGAAAQNYFDYNLDDPANNVKDGIVMPTLKAWNSEMMTDINPANTKLTGSPIVTDNGKTLELEGAIRVHYYFGLKETLAAPVTAKLQVWDGVTGELTEDNVTRSIPMTLINGKYTAASADIPSAEYGKTLYVRAHFVDAENNEYNSAVVAYSPEKYAAGRIEKSESDELKTLVKQMVIYGEYAQEYFANLPKN